MLLNYNRAIILGSRGFIGNILMRELPKYGIEVIGITRDYGDLSDINVLNRIFNLYPNCYLINTAYTGGKTRLGEFNVGELITNIKIVDNLISLKGKYLNLINIGSGAEYDISKPINNVKEDDVINFVPKDSYGLGKNIIARMIIDNDFGFNLKLFMCFDKTDPSFRLIPTFIRSIEKTGEFIIEQDRSISLISGNDFSKIVANVIKRDGVDLIPCDINCVYSQSIQLSSLLHQFANIHNMNYKIIVKDYNGYNYTANGSYCRDVKLFDGDLSTAIKTYF